MRDLVSIWVQLARHHTGIALQRLRTRKGQVAVTTCCTALALALPAVLLLFVLNASELVSSWRENYAVTVYLDSDLSDEDGARLATEWRTLDAVADTSVITRVQAARDFAEATGAGDLIKALGENPLPVVIRIWPKATFANSQAVQTLSDRLLESHGIDEIDLDINWLERADAILATSIRGVALVGSLLVLIAVMFIGDSMRQQLVALTDEIALSKLIGATDNTLRTPFLISGAIIGLLSGLLALALTALVQLFLSGPIAALAASYQSPFQLELIGLGPGLSLVVLAVLIGAAGAACAIEFKLRRIQADGHPE